MTNNTKDNATSIFTFPLAEKKPVSPAAEGVNGSATANENKKPKPNGNNK